MDANRLVDAEIAEFEEPEELSLRPSRLTEWIGQEEIRANLLVYVRAACERGEPLDHALLVGPPGLGKTTLAHIIAAEMGTRLHVTSGPAIQKKGDLAGVLTNLERGDVLFIDEVHRLQPAIEEILYPAMEDYFLDVMIGEGPGARSAQIPLPRFTLVGATTRAGLLSAPMRGRFGIDLRLNFYPADELQEIVRRSAALLGVALTECGAGEIARRSRGTPRIANRLLRRVRDFAQVDAVAEVDRGAADSALTRLKVDALGLDELDRRVLEALVRTFGGGPVGIDTLAAACAEEAHTIEEVVEPFLLQIGMLARTPRGRTATKAAFNHLGAKIPPGSQGTFL